MSRPSIFYLIAIFLSATVLASADDSDDSAIEQQAADIAMSTANFLASQDDIAFNWFVSYDVIVAENEKITYFRSGNVLLDRGNGFVAKTELGNTYRDFYFDGSVFTVASPNENFYASTRVEGSFDTLAKAVRERSDTILPLWSMLSEQLPDRMLENVNGGAYLGTTLIAGQLAHHLAFSQADEDWQIWISVEDDVPVPLMLIGTDRNKAGWPQYRAYFSEWNLDPEIADGEFSYQPEDDDVRMSFPTTAQAGQPVSTQSE